MNPNEKDADNERLGAWVGFSLSQARLITKDLLNLAMICFAKGSDEGA